MRERFLRLKDNGQRENVIAARLHYELGGTSWSGEVKPRGYYLTLTPMKVIEENGFITRSFQLFGGGSGYALLLEVPRRSKSRDREALLECQRRIPELVQTVLRNTGFELEKNEALSIVEP